ncbi:hypothetical protein PTKU64_68500 [Paraburkholderia terrae]|uniref:Uncharacterized protein n=1 Tax=Paraburkholderia terrae TaxID=311230 RepID=A0ABM7TX69_9BURK|nr:hypothetical protein PTKU64_68500 [Paraburkholderia terrae]
MLTVARKQAGKREFANRYVLTSRQQIQNTWEFLANNKSKARQRGQHDGRKYHLLDNSKIQFHDCTPSYRLRQTREDTFGRSFLYRHHEMGSQIFPDLPRRMSGGMDGAFNPRNNRAENSR